MTASFRTLSGALALLLVIVSITSLAVGETLFNIWQVIQTLSHDRSSLTSLIILELRLPRLLLTILAGASLAISGAALQGYLRNPLAEPSLLGISNGAALGAVCIFYFGLSTLHPWLLPLAGIAGAFLTGVALYFLAGKMGTSYTLILAGIAMSSVSGALIAIVLNIVPNPYAALEIVHWLMGSVSERSIYDAIIIAPLVILGWALLLASGKNLEALSLGEEVAVTLGISPRRTQLLLIAGTACCVGAAVSVTGSIGFIGLVVPHIMRRFADHNPRKLLWISAPAGAILLTMADIAVRLIPTSGAELKLGVVTAIIGVPFFFHLIWKTRSRMVA